MDRRENPLVIAAAAVSGGGKTTIATKLNQSLKNSRALYFDNYDFKGPDITL
jgi:uridine kinase